MPRAIERSSLKQMFLIGENAKGKWGEIFFSKLYGKVEKSNFFY